jgi:hypothetical protein
MVTASIEREMMAGADWSPGQPGSIATVFVPIALKRKLTTPPLLAPPTFPFPVFVLLPSALALHGLYAQRCVLMNLPPGS